MKIKLAVVQMACGEAEADNVEHAEQRVREAAAAGAHIILLQELFANPYFCKVQDPAYFELARPRDSNPLIKHFSGLAAELEVVVPLSFFERAGNAYFNSMVMLDADGRDLGLYRKSHIPDGPGYQEKFYFSPGDTGFKVWQTRYGRIGAAICWDQWFPEAARVMALQGADLLLYPSAIGSEPEAPELDSSAHWRRTMLGHAAANMLPLGACNRVGREAVDGCEITFYGQSFISDGTGSVIAEGNRVDDQVVYAELDLDALRRERIGLGLFRDRRPDLYGTIGSLDGASVTGP